MTSATRMFATAEVSSRMVLFTLSASTKPRQNVSFRQMVSARTARADQATMTGPAAARESGVNAAPSTAGVSP